MPILIWGIVNVYDGHILAYKCVIFVMYRLKAPLLIHVIVDNIEAGFLFLISY